MSTTSNSSLERGGKKGKRAKSKAELPGSGISSPPEKAKGGKVTPLAPHSGTNRVVPPTDGGEKAIEKPTSGKLFSPGDDQTSVGERSEFLKNRDLRDTSDSEDEGDPTDPILQPEPYRGREKPDPPRDAERIDPNDSEVRRSREADDADWEEYFEEEKQVKRGRRATREGGVEKGSEGEGSVAPGSGIPREEDDSRDGVDEREIDRDG